MHNTALESVTNFATFIVTIVEVRILRKILRVGEKKVPDQ